jgi:hypothetical protein
MVCQSLEEQGFAGPCEKIPQQRNIELRYCASLCLCTDENPAIGIQQKYFARRGCCRTLQVGLQVAQVEHGHQGTHQYIAV